MSVLTVDLTPLVKAIHAELQPDLDAILAAVEAQATGGGVSVQ